MNARQTNWQGMNWITQKKRLAIYLRDGCACVYCGAAVEDGVQLTLDHLIPVSKGGDNDASNLVTACKNCNDSRGDRPVFKFCRAVAEYLNHGIDHKEILKHVRRTACRSLIPHLAKAAKLIEQRGSAFKVLQTRKEWQ